MGEYLTPEEAREKWAADNDLPIDMAPLFPEGTREYAQYREKLTAALDEWTRGGPR